MGRHVHILGEEWGVRRDTKAPTHVCTSALTSHTFSHFKLLESFFFFCVLHNFRKRSKKAAQCLDGEAAYQNAGHLENLVVGVFSSWFQSSTELVCQQWLGRCHRAGLDSSPTSALYLFICFQSQHNWYCYLSWINQFSTLPSIKIMIIIIIICKSGIAKLLTGSIPTITACSTQRTRFCYVFLCCISQWSLKVLLTSTGPECVAVLAVWGNGGSNGGSNESHHLESLSRKAITGFIPVNYYLTVMVNITVTYLLLNQMCMCVCATQIPCRDHYNEGEDSATSYAA